MPKNLLMRAHCPGPPPPPPTPKKKKLKKSRKYTLTHGEGIFFPIATGLTPVVIRLESGRICDRSFCTFKTLVLGAGLRSGWHAPVCAPPGPRGGSTDARCDKAWLGAGLGDILVQEVCPGPGDHDHNKHGLGLPSRGAASARWRYSIASGNGGHGWEGGRSGVDGCVVAMGSCIVTTYLAQLQGKEPS